MFVVLLSLFVYPGSGHLMLGRKREAAIFAGIFTLATLGVLYEISQMIPELMRVVQESVDMGGALTIPQMPNLPRAGLWTTLTGAIWTVCAVHAGIVSARAAREWRPKAELTAPEGQTTTQVADRLPTTDPTEA